MNDSQFPYTITLRANECEEEFTVTCWDVTCDALVETFARALLGAGFNEETIRRTFDEFNDG